MDISELISDGSTDLNKQDILQLLNTGIKENQSFAKWFADTILVDIQRKFKDIRIQSSAIQIDGEGISKHINQQIKDGMDENVDDIVKTVTAKIKKDIKPAKANIVKSSQKDDKSDVPRVSPKNEKMDSSISSIIGITPKMSLLNQLRYQGIVKNLLDKISKGMPDNFNIKEASLSDIFRPPGNKATDTIMFVRHFKQWNNLQSKITEKVISGLPANSFDFKKVGLGDIFRPPNISGLGQTAVAALSFRSWLRWMKLQNDITENVSSSIKAAPMQFKKGITFSQIFGENEKSSFLSALKWNRLQNILIKKIEKSTDESLSKSNPLLPVKGTTSKIKGGAQKEKKSEFNSLIEAIPSLIAKPKEEKKGFRSLEEKEPTVRVAGFTREALKDLSSIPGLGKLGKVSVDVKQKKESSLLDWVKGIGLAGLALIAGGIAAGIKGLFDDGPFKGLEKIIARGAIRLGSSLVKFASKASIKVIDGIGKIFGRQIASIAKLFGSGASKAAAPIAKILKGGIGSKIVGLFGKLFSKSVLKKLPFGIGTIFGIGYGISRFAQGDILGGLLEFGSGMASIFPGLGTALSVAIDVLLAARDVKGGGTKELAKKSSFNLAWKEKLLPLIEKIPLLNALIKIPKAIGAFSTGDWKNGLKELADIIPGVSVIYGMVAGASKEVNEPAVSGKPKSIGEIMQDMVVGSMKGWWKTAPYWLKKVIKSTGLLGKMGVSFDEGKSGIDESMVSVPTAKTEAPKPMDVAKPTQSKVLDARTAHDFIWRKGQAIQKFDSEDSIISTKSDGAFSKLIDTLKDGKEDKQKLTQQIDRMSKDVNKLIIKMDGVMTVLINSAKQTGNDATVQVKGNLPDISGDEGSMRDPAYILRSRAWDRIRKGYVVI